MRTFRVDESAAPWLPMTSVAVGVVTWGFASPLIKLAGIGGPALGFHRLWIGAAVLLVVLLGGRQEFDRRSLRWSLPAGGIFGVNMVLFIVAVRTTTVANATLIGALQPAITLLVAGRWFGERVTSREVAAVAVAIFGVAIVIVGSSGKPEWNPLGDALALCSVLAFTAYFLISKRARATVSTLEYMAVMHAAAALVALPIALGRPSDLWRLGWGDVAIVLFIALVSGTGGQFIIGWAQRFVDVSVSSLMMLGVPVVATLGAWAMLGESLGPMQAVGGLVTLAAIAAMVRRPSSVATSLPAVEERTPVVGMQER